MPQSLIPEKMVRWLFHDDETLSLNKVEWMKLLFAVSIKANRSFTQNFVTALQEKITETDNSPSLSEEQKQILRFTALSFLAYAHPQANDQITVNGIRYDIQRIKLTSGWFSAPYYAYGLRSNAIGAESILIFQGTTVPSDRGFLAGLLADTRPVGSVGSMLYQRGKKAIEAWTASEFQRTGKPVICTGQSLGGGLSMLAHINQPDQVDFFVLNPPSLTTREERIYTHRRRECSPFNPDQRTLKVVTHNADPVWKLGSRYLPSGSKIYRYGDPDTNPILAHARAPQFPMTTDRVDFQNQNIPKKRNIGWKLQKLVLFPVVFLLALIVFLPRAILQVAEKIKNFHTNSNSVRRNLTYSAFTLLAAVGVLGVLSLPTLGILPLSLAVIVGSSLLLSSLIPTIFAITLKIREALKPSIILDINEGNSLNPQNTHTSILNILINPPVASAKSDLRTVTTWEKVRHETVKINYHSDAHHNQEFILEKKCFISFLNAQVRQKNLRTALLNLESTKQEINNTLLCL